MKKLTSEQEAALQAMQSFLKSPDERVFVLKGAAGTGKTTLVKAVVDWLSDNEFRPVLLASTGRAAQVLSEKSNYTATTVHGHIYTFDEVFERDASSEKEDGQLQLNFGLKSNELKTSSHVYIIDEASMLSHTINKETNTAKFGTGSLLNDLMSFTDPNKIIFVGDHCQLPPVAESDFSSALSIDFLSDAYRLRGTSFELRKILRQDSGNEILEIAGKFRKGIESETFQKYPKIDLSRSRLEHAQVHADEKALVEAYVKAIETKGLSTQIMIAHSNWSCLENNRAIRRLLGKNDALNVGDLLMVAQNNYLVPLVNGDLVEVVAIIEKTRYLDMRFVKAELRLLGTVHTFTLFLIADFLYQKESSLPLSMSNKLLWDFDHRMRKSGISRKSDEYKEALRKDVYLNALRAKFGYCITCHKSQGGEWEEVYLMLQKGIFALQGAALYRWFYTAITRAREKLHIHRAWWVVE